MDGAPLPKSKKYGGQLYSETRYAVIKWLEKELPKITGDVINISSGNWPIPKQLLTNKDLKSYKTCDLKNYGDNQNKVDFIADVHNLPQEWTNKWDCVINNQAIECYENPFKAMDEMYRILKPGGVLLIDCPFNYVFFGHGANKDSLKKKNKVNDYWRITKNGWELLTKKFNKVSIEGFGGSGEHDRFVYCVRAFKYINIMIKIGDEMFKIKDLRKDFKNSSNGGIDVIFKIEDVKTGTETKDIVIQFCNPRNNNYVIMMDSDKILGQHKNIVADEVRKHLNDKDFQSIGWEINNNGDWGFKHDIKNN